MPRSKDFGRTHEAISQKEFSEGKLHLPDTRKIDRSVSYATGEVPDAETLEPLSSAHPVIHEDYIDRLRSSLDVVTFDKFVDTKISAHGVGFGVFKMAGRVALEKELAIESQPEQLSVALKPFNDAEGAVHEMYGYGVLRALGVETFDPIGVFSARHGNHFVLASEKRNDLQSLDRREWVIGGYVKDEEGAEILMRNHDTVTNVAKTMAFLNVNGVFHMDGQIKNWAITPESDIGVIDTENLEVVPLKDETAVDLAWQNMEKLVKSLTRMSSDSDEEVKVFGVGLFAGMNPEDLRDNVKRLLIDPYLHSLFSEALASEDDAKLEQAEMLIKNTEKRFTDDERWPSTIVGVQKIEHATRELSILRM